MLLFGIILGIAIMATIVTLRFYPTAAHTSPVLEQPETTLATVEALKKQELELANQLVEDFPRDQVTINLLANVHNNHGNRTEAQKYWEQIVLLNPNNAAAYDSMARIALLKEEHAKAIQLWQKTLQIDPNMFGVHFRLAHALMAMGQSQQATAALKKDLEISPKASWSYYLLGQLYLQLKDYKQAKQNFKAAIQIQHGNAKAYYGLATVCMRLEQTDEARKFMEEFKKLKAQDVRADKDRRSTYDDLEAIRSQVAETCTEAGNIYHRRSNTQKAEQLWRTAATLDAENIACRMNLAALYQWNNSVVQALEISEQLRVLEPDNPNRHFNVGVLNARLNKFKAAEKAFQMSRELAPQQSDSYRMLAQMYIEMGRATAETLALARKAVQLEPKAENYFVLGAAFVKNGNRTEALAALKRAIELDPNNPKYQHIYELFQKRIQKEN
ncbi:MAG: tetratricopeptide repeat protein [candidate division Zixibacteria bacterium]